MVMPRTRETRLFRERWRIDKEHVGKESMKETCPRCGWPCTHTVTPYYDSPWKAYGGFCSQCCLEAVATFEQKGWPPDPYAEDEKPAVVKKSTKGVPKQDEALFDK